MPSCRRAPVLAVCAVACAVAASAGCMARKPNYLFVEPRGDGIRIELRREVGVWEREEVPVPLADCGFFAITPADPDALARLPPQEIWRVTTVDPDVTVPGIWYGAVPEGFVQVRPHGQPAPELIPGDRYVVECSGHAIGATEFRMPYPENPEGYAGRDERTPED